MSKVEVVGRQEPSKEAVDRFIEIYLEIVEKNKLKAREKAREEKN